MIEIVGEWREGEALSMWRKFKFKGETWTIYARCKNGRWTCDLYKGDFEKSRGWGTFLGVDLFTLYDVSVGADERDKVKEMCITATRKFLMSIENDKCARCDNDAEIHIETNKTCLYYGLCWDCFNEKLDMILNKGWWWCVVKERDVVDAIINVKAVKGECEITLQW